MHLVSVCQSECIIVKLLYVNIKASMASVCYTEQILKQVKQMSVLTSCHCVRVCAHKACIIASMIVIQKPAPCVRETLTGVFTSRTHLLLLLRLPHRAVVFLLVKDFLHFTVLQVVQLSDSILRPLDEIDQDPQRTLSPYKVMLETDKRGVL